MTRAAVMEGFEQFLGDAIEQTGEEFSVSRVLGGDGGGTLDQFLGDSDVLHENLVEPELAAYEAETVEQFDLILDGVESDEPVADYRDDILAAGPFTDNIGPDVDDETRQAVEDRLFERHVALGEAVEPLVHSPEESFWEAVVAELDPVVAGEMVKEHFAFTGPLQEHRGALEMTVTFDPEEVLGGLGGMLGGSTFDIEFTDEALRAMRHAERAVIAEAKGEIDDRFQ
jgi:hypothetical protein